MSKKISVKLLFPLLLSPAVLSAQETGRMETDRPDQTEAVYITKKNYLQAELGFNFESDQGQFTLVHPTALWKYGLTKKFELRLITEFISAETPLLIPSGNDVQSGLLPLQLGGKVALWEEKGLLPKTSLIAHLGIPKAGSKKFHTTRWFPSFRFTFQNSITENIALGYNLGAEWDGEDTSPDWIYTFAPGFNLGKKWYGYAELYGSVRKNEAPAHHVAGGLACYFSDNSKLDFSGSYGITEVANDWYVAIGYSFRLPLYKKR
ncbi:MAG: transporter [Bacteroidetes bacterium]|nr:transporter [Bacteroidota bacterium]